MSRQMDFDEWLKTHANKEVNISLYSLLTKKIREIKITTNPIGSKDGILGASVKKENWTIANKNVIISKKFLLSAKLILFSLILISSFRKKNGVIFNLLIIR